MLISRKPALLVLLFFTMAALALIFSSSALTKGQSVVQAQSAPQAPGAKLETTDEGFDTEDEAVPSAAKKKPPPFCKKHQKSTKKHPCRKKPKKFTALRENPPVAGWTFGFSLSHANNGTWGLTVRLARTAGNVTERHFYSFQLAASSVTVAPDLSSGTIDTGSQLGQFGSMKLTFGNASALGTGTAVPGCTGNWQKRTGTLTGPINFVADNTYFHAIVRTSIPATVNANIGSMPVCKPQPPPCTHLTLLIAGNLQNLTAFFEAFNTGGVLTFVEYLTQTVGPAAVTHQLLEANLPASDFSTAADLSGGTVATTGALSFTGSLSYTASGPVTKVPSPFCGGTSASYTQGTVTGGMTAKFAAIPAVQAPIGPALAETL